MPLIFHLLQWNLHHVHGLHGSHYHFGCKLNRVLQNCDCLQSKLSKGNTQRIALSILQKKELLEEPIS